VKSDSTVMVRRQSSEASVSDSSDAGFGRDKTRVLICDDHDLIRQALRAVISAEPDMEVVGEASNGSQAVTLTRDLRPDTVIMDLQMPGISGIEATRRIKTLMPHTTVIVLTVHEENEYILRALEAGAAGYLTKGVISKEIPMVIRTAASGECILSEAILNKLVVYTRQFPSEDVRSKIDSSNLTDRETEIVCLVAQGLSNKIVAAKLHLSENTVKKYMMSIFLKLGVSSRTAMVSAARDRGLTNDHD